MSDFKLFFDKSPAIVLLTDSVTGAIADANQAALAFYGYDYSTILSLNISDLHVPDIKGMEGRIGSAEEDKGLNATYYHKRKDGSLRPIKALISEVNIHGRLLNMAIMEDITDSLKTKRFFEFIAQTNDLVLNTRDANQILLEICNIAVETGGFLFAWIGSANEITKTISPLTWAGKEEGYLNAITITVDKDRVEGVGPTAKAYREGKYYYCNDIENDPMMAPWRKEALKRGYLSSVTYPIKIDGEVEFIIALYADKRNYFSEEELKLLIRVIGNIETGLNAIKANTRRTLAEEKHRQLSELIDNSSVFMGILDFEQRLIYSNKAMQDAFGTEIYEKGIVNFDKIYTPRGMLIRKQAEKQLKKEGKWIGESEVIDKQGNIIPVYEVISNQRIGKSDFILVTSFDISDIKRAQAEINDLSKIVENTTTFIARADLQRKFLYANKAMRDVLEIPDEEDISKLPINDYIFNSSQFLIERAEIIREKGKWAGENIFVSRSGKKIPVIQVIVLHKNQYGEPVGTSTTAIDISEIKDLEMRYTSFFENSMDAFLITSIDGEIYDANPAAINLLGYQRDEIIKANSQNIVYNKDHSFDRFRQERLIHGKAKGFLKYRKANGLLIDMLVSSIKYEDIQGQSKCLVIAHDLSDLILAQERIVKSEEAFQTLLKRINEGFISLDHKFIISYINTKAIQLMGLENDQDHLGKSFIELIDRGRHVLLIKRMNKALQQQQEQIFDDYDDHIHLWLSYHIYPSENGLSLIVSDITKEKRLEIKLKKQKQHEEHLIALYTLKAQEEERNMIAQELHDNVNQILAGSLLILSAAKFNHEYAGQEIENCIGYLRSAIDENRKIAHRLVTPDFESNPDKIKELLNYLCEGITMAAGIICEVDLSLFNEGLLNNDQKLAIYRIIQEQFSNIIKHSKAKNVHVKFSMISTKFNMTIEDDGVGVGDNKKINGIGLINIRRRVLHHNGTVNITTAAGMGFKMEIEFPIQGIG